MDVVPAEPRRRRGVAWLAWLVIVCVVGFILVRAAQRAQRAADTTTSDATGWLVPLQLQGRYLVGLGDLGLPGVNGKMLLEQTAALNRGPFGQRVRVAILAGELGGAREARQLLGPMMKESDSALPMLLDRLYAGYERHGPEHIALNETEQQGLRERLGWFGELALAPAGSDAAARQVVLAPAQRTAIAALALMFLLFAALAVGACVLAGLGAFALAGRLQHHLSDDSHFGGVYAEMFALYLVVFVGLNILARYLPFHEPLPDMALSGAIMLASMSVLVWPVLRGASWRQVRQDLGLHTGAGVLKETLAGVAGYLAALPLVLLALLFMLGLMFLFRHFDLGRDPTEPGNTPTHPVIEVALEHNIALWFAVAVVAAVLAPLVEETMFRGALQRHLRERLGMGRFGSVVFAMLGSGFVFAVIHPQGWFGVPVLMTLAAVFSLMREWRGSLIGPMVAHGINNGVSLTVLLVMAG